MSSKLLRSALLAPALLAATAAGPVLGAQSKPPAAPSPAKLKEIVAHWFAAKPEERAELSKGLPGQLGAADDLTPAEVKKWVPQLLDAMKAAAKKGQKLETTGTNYLYDEKEKRGKYIVHVSGKPKQLIVCLHGGGAGAGAAEEAVSGFASALHSLKNTAVIYPEVLEKTEHGWTDSGTEPFIFDLIEAAKRTWPIDTDHVYLCGHSMGGFGTWTLGSRRADLFAGLAAFAGAPTPFFDPKDNTKVIGISDGVLPNLMNLPIFVYQSGDDHNVPPQTNDCALPLLDQLRADAKEKGYEHVYERVEGRGHNFPEKGPGPGVEWALSHVRNPRPKKIVWQPSLASVTTFYWLQNLHPSLGKTVTVEITGPNVIEFSGAASRKGFTLLLDERLVDLTKPVFVKEDGKEVFRGFPKPKLSTLLETAAERHDPEYVFPVQIDL